MMLVSGTIKDQVTPNAKSVYSCNTVSNLRIQNRYLSDKRFFQELVFGNIEKFSIASPRLSPLFTIFKSKCNCTFKEDDVCPCLEN